nr:xylulose kinase-1 [Tanacetum cinerariifolium]
MTMSTPTFAETHNLVAFLEKPAELAGFEQIIDFLKSKPIHYALTVNPTIYVSCVKQFWATAKVKKVNDQEQIQALVDKMKVIITEDSIRSDLHFDDAEGTVCLLNEAIFEDKQVKGMERYKEMYIISSHTKTIFANMRRIGAGFSRTQKPRRKQRKEEAVSYDKSEDEDHVPTLSNDPLPSGADSYILNELMVYCTSLQEQGRTNENEMFGVDDLAGEEVVMETTTGVKDSATPTTDVTKDESAKPKIVVQEQEISTTILAAAIIVTIVVPTPRAKGIVFHKQKQPQIPTVSSSKDKGEGKMIEPEVPIKRKELMRIDEEEMTKVNDLMDMDSEAQESSTKRTAEHLESNISMSY